MQSSNEKSSKSGAAGIPVAALKRFANELERDPVSNKFLQINLERVQHFIDKPSAENSKNSSDTNKNSSQKQTNNNVYITKSSRDNQRKKPHRTVVRGIYNYDTIDEKSLIQLQNVPEFQKSLGFRSRFGEGDGSFFDQWLNSGINCSRRIVDSNGLPLVKSSLNHSHTGFKKHLIELKSDNNDDAKAYVKAYADKRKERSKKINQTGHDIQSPTGQNHLSQTLASNSGFDEYIFDSNPKYSANLKIRSSDHIPLSDTSKLPPLTCTPIEKDNYFGSHARMAFFDYYKQLSRQPFTIEREEDIIIQHQNNDKNRRNNNSMPRKSIDKKDIHLKIDANNAENNTHDTSHDNLSPKMSPYSEKPYHLDINPLLRSDSFRYAPKKIDAKQAKSNMELNNKYLFNETIEKSKDESNLLEIHLSQASLNDLTIIPPKHNNPSSSTARPHSARTLFLMGCIDKGISPQPSLIIRKELTTILNLSSRSIGDKVAILLAESLDSLPMLQGLYLVDNKLTDISLVPIINNLERCIHLSKFDISNNVLSVQGAEALSDYLQSEKCHLISLYLRSTNIDDIGANKFISAISVRKTVRDFDLSVNKLGFYAIQSNFKRVSSIIPTAESLSKLLNDPKCQIEMLKLAWNSIGKDSGAISFMKSIKENKSLTILDISYNRLGNEGGDCLGDSLQYNHTLKYLKISHNNITSKTCFNILCGVRSCKSLVEVDLSENPIGEGGTKALMSLSISPYNYVTVDIKGCSLRIKDPSCWFDVNNLEKEYNLDLSSSYERSVCIEILRHIAYKNNECKLIECHLSSSSDSPSSQFVAMNLAVYVSENSDNNNNNTHNGKLGSKTKSLLFNKKSFDSFDSEGDTRTNEITSYQMYEIASDLDVARIQFQKHAIKLFKKFDVDDNGSLDKEEIALLLTKLGLESSSEIVQELMNMYDVDGSGLIEEEEFINYLKDIRIVFEKTHDIHNILSEMRYIYNNDIKTLDVNTYKPIPFVPPYTGYIHLLISNEGINNNDTGDTINYTNLAPQNIELMLAMSKLVTEDISNVFDSALKQLTLTFEQGKLFYDIMLKELGSKTIVLSKLLPSMVTPNDAWLLITSTCTDIRSMVTLRQQIGVAFLLYFGMPNNYYCLHLSDPMDRSCFLKLVMINNKLLSLRRDGLKKGDTSQHGNYMCFRNVIFEQKSFIITEEFLKKIPEKGKICFDFISLQEIKPESRLPISNLRLFRLLSGLKIVAPELRVRLFQKLSSYTTEGRSASKGNGVRKWELMTNYAWSIRQYVDNLYDYNNLKNRKYVNFRDTVCNEILMMDQINQNNNININNNNNGDGNNKKNLISEIVLDKGDSKLCELYENHISNLKQSSGDIYTQMTMVPMHTLFALEHMLGGRYITCAQLAIIIEYFPRGSDKINDYRYLNIWNPLKAEGGLCLNISRREERQILRILLVLTYIEPGESWTEKSFRISYDSEIIDDWKLPVVWYTENGLPENGIFSVHIFSGKGLGIDGCAPNFTCRMTLMSLVLACPYEEELKQFHNVTIDKAEQYLSDVGLDDDYRGGKGVPNTTAAGPSGFLSNRTGPFCMI
eukprot:gene4053-5796_t